MCEVFLYPYSKKTNKTHQTQTQPKQLKPEKALRFKGYGFILRQQQQAYFCL